MQQHDLEEILTEFNRGRFGFEYANLRVQLDIAQSLRTIASALQPDEDIPDVDER